MLSFSKYTLGWCIVLFSIFQCQRATPNAGSIEMERALRQEYGDGKVSQLEFDLLKNQVLNLAEVRFKREPETLFTDRKYWREEVHGRHYYRAKVWYENAQGVKIEVYRVMVTRTGIADSCERANNF